MKNVLRYVLPTLLCFVVGGLAGVLMMDSVFHWYPFLDKPALTPPNIAFPIAWSIIYLFMGVSAGLVLNSRSSRRRTVMAIWGVQLLLNFLWSILFFTLRSPLAGWIDILLLDALITYYIIRAWRVNRIAALLFVPYLAWTLFATYLNTYILLAN